MEGDAGLVYRTTFTLFHSFVIFSLSIFALLSLYPEPLKITRVLQVHQERTCTLGTTCTIKAGSGPSTMSSY